jgi:hypothetical protein
VFLLGYTDRLDGGLAHKLSDDLFFYSCDSIIEFVLYGKERIVLAGSDFGIVVDFIAPYKVTENIQQPMNHCTMSANDDGSTDSWNTHCTIEVTIKNMRMKTCICSIFTRVVPKEDHNFHDEMYVTRIGMSIDVTLEN